MAQCKLTPQEFIQNAFSPVVAVLCSPLVDQACRKNNLSFIELLQPFCKLNVEAQIRDPSGNAVTVRNLRITVMDINARPPQPTLARKFLNSSVTLTADIRTSSVNVNDMTLEVPSANPWFETWRDTFLQVQYPSDHEFTKHFLSCMIVVSSSEPNPLETVNHMLQTLTQLQSSTPTKLPKWFGSNILRYFVVLHDAFEGNHENAVKTIESLKQSYGINNCFLLQMNSRPPDSSNDQFLPDPWSQFLMRKTENIDIPESESPRTPADSTGVTSMPNNVTTNVPPISGSNTSPIMNRNILQKLEVGQEANEASVTPVTFHPLSPDAESIGAISADEDDNIFVPINSNVWQGTSSTPTVVHGACLLTDDIEQLKLLVHEFCLRSLLPFIEKQIQLLSDMVSNKKGVSRSLFSATKRWFTPNKLGSSGAVTAVNAIIYANDSPELQLRRLGDLYFMFGHYNMAFQVYHSAKRDFNADQAWLYYAGALEMAALSAFMCGEVTRKTCDYMEESIVTYLYTCRMPQFATRATLLSTECLKGKGQYGEAAHQFIRMTSEDSDLRSALLLEQAAYCFLYCNKPRMVRKYAFHIVLAGHRFSKCLQRKHSLRCYRQAFQVYNKKGWSLAEDHIHFTIGRQASNLKQLVEATDAFSLLLTPYSRQNAQQQTVFLREYLNAHHLLMKNNDQPTTTLPILPLPVLNSDETKVLLGPQPPVSTPGRIPASGVTFETDINAPVYQKWNKLEEMMVQEAYGSQPMVFKPMITFFSSKNSGSTKPIAVMGEPIQISLSLHNPLQIVLPLKNLYLLWTFKAKDSDEVISNECVEEAKTNQFIRTHALNFVNLAPGYKEDLILSVTPLAIGELVIEAICYSITNTSVQEGSVNVTGKQVFNIRGPKLTVKDKAAPQTYGKDKRLEIIIAPSAPCLQVGFSELNQELLCNELQNVTIELRNCGSTPLHKIMMASSLPHLIFLSSGSTVPKYKPPEEANTDNPASKERDMRKNHIIPIVLPANLNGRLEPGQSHIMNMWIKAPFTKGPALIDLLFYYENVDPQSIPKYRLVRHMWHLSIQDSLETEINARHSCNNNDTETMTLSLRATNSNQIHHAVISEITLLQASLISSNWKLSKDVIIPRDVKLLSQESVHLLLKFSRSVNMKQDLNYSELLLSLHMKENTDLKLPCKYFAHRNMAFELNAFTSLTETREEIFNSIEAMLVLGWHGLVTDSAGNRRTVVGQHCVPVWKIAKVQENANIASHTLFSPNIQSNQLYPISDTKTSMSILQKQVIYSLNHPPVLMHDFKNNNLCIVPVKLVLHSSAKTDLLVKVNTLGTSSALSLNTNKNELFNPNSSNNFRWMGHSEFLCLLKPYSSHHLLLSVAVIGPGTYDLGDRIEIICRSVNQPLEPVLQVCRVQSALIIK